MKKIIKTVIATATALTAIVAFANNSNSPIKNKDSLLWKISGNDLKQPSYLYGTMHLVCNNQGTEKLKVQNAIDESSQLYLELDMDDPKMPLEMMGFLKDVTKIKDIENLEKKEKLLSLASKHLDMKPRIIEQTDLFSLFSLLTFKSASQCAMPSSVEQALINEFKSDKKSIEGLETVKEQMGFLMESGAVDLDALILSLEEFDEMKDMYVDMTEYYENEDLTALHSFIMTPNDLYPKEYLQKMTSIIVDQRNLNWLNVIPGIAKQDSTFFGVGAGHLSGEKGLIQLLRNQGYQLEAVLD